MVFQKVHISQNFSQFTFCEQGGQFSCDTFSEYESFFCKAKKFSGLQKRMLVPLCHSFKLTNFQPDLLMVSVVTAVCLFAKLACAVSTLFKQ